MLNPVINPDFRIVSLQYRERISDHVWQCVRSVQVGWQNSDIGDWVKKKGCKNVDFFDIW